MERLSRVFVALLLITNNLLQCSAEITLMYSLPTSNSEEIIFCLAKVAEEYPDALIIIDEIEVGNSASDDAALVSVKEDRIIIDAKPTDAACIPDSAQILQIYDDKTFLYLTHDNAVCYFRDGNTVEIAHIQYDVRNRVKLNGSGNKIALISDEGALILYDSNRKTELIQNGVLGFDWYTDDVIMYWKEELTFKDDLYFSDIRLAAINTVSMKNDYLVNTSHHYITLPKDYNYITYAMSCKDGIVASIIHDNAFSWDGDQVYMYIVWLNENKSVVLKPYVLIDEIRVWCKVCASKGGYVVKVVNTSVSSS